MGDVRWRRLVVAASLGLAAGMSATASPAAAQDGSCRTQIENLPTGEDGPEPPGVGVSISSPLPRQQVSGVSRVTGTATSTVSLTRVELFLAGSLLDHQDFEPDTTLRFDLRWDTDDANVGTSVLAVVACGASGAGQSIVAVRVPARRPAWVGVAVGLGGIGGLALSSAFRRTPPRRQGDPRRSQLRT